MANDQTDVDKLRAIRHLIIDMDGVLYRGDEPLPGVGDFFAFLRERCIRFVLATNNSTRTGQQYVAVMARMGVEVALSEVLTSAQATAKTLRRQTAPGTTVYVIGEGGLQQALLDQGFVPTADGAQCVVVGMDRALTYGKLKAATLLIRGGAPFIATNPDRTLPTEEGEVPGTGAILAALEAATGVAPTVVGKPEPTMYELAMEMMGAAPATTAAIGDRLETDILGGQRAGTTTICVLSGVTTPDVLQRSPIRPDLVFDDVAQLLETWRKL